MYWVGSGMGEYEFYYVGILTGVFLSVERFMEVKKINIIPRINLNHL